MKTALSLRGRFLPEAIPNAIWRLFHELRYSETCITRHDRTGMNPPCY